MPDIRLKQLVVATTPAVSIRDERFHLQYHNLDQHLDYFFFAPEVLEATLRSTIDWPIEVMQITSTLNW